MATIWYGQSLLVLSKGERNWDEARLVASRASRRVVSCSSVVTLAISVSTLLWCVGLQIPAISWDLIMSGAYVDTVGVPQLPFDWKSHNMACTLRRKMNVTDTFTATDLMYPRRLFSDAYLLRTFRTDKVEQHLMLILDKQVDRSYRYGQLQGHSEVGYVFVSIPWVFENYPAVVGAILPRLLDGLAFGYEVFFVDLVCCYRLTVSQIE